MATNTDNFWLTSILNLLVDKDGELSVEEIDKILKEQSQLGARDGSVFFPDIKSIISPNIGISLTTNSTSDLEDSSSIRINIGAIICHKYMSKQGCHYPKCERIHSCRAYIQHECKRQNCRYSHDLRRGHNGKAVTKYSLEGLTDECLLKLLKLKSRKSGIEKRKIPGICSLYNDSRGKKCLDEENCQSLHICRFFLKNNCRNGETCDKSHILDEHSTDILEKYGYDTYKSDKDILEDLRGSISQSTKVSSRSNNFQGQNLQVKPKLYPQNVKMMANRNVNEVTTISKSAPKISNQDSPTKMMKICTFYNKSTGCTAKECQALHVCFHHVVGENCRHGGRCNKSHDILDAQPKLLLEKYGVDVSKPVETIQQDIKNQYSRATGIQPINPPCRRYQQEKSNDNDCEEEKGQRCKVLRICMRYNSDNKCYYKNCNKLHVCKDYLISGTCKKGEKNCESSHNVLNNQARPILEAIGFDMVKDSKSILRDIREKFLKVCIHYNNATCKHGDDCRAMHICFQYMTGEGCKFGEDVCRRSHNILDPQPKRVIEKRGFSTKRDEKLLLEEIRLEIPWKGKRKESSNEEQSAESDKDFQQICTYFLCGTCKFGEENCRSKHAEQPYFWQYNNHDNGDFAWRDFECSNNKVIETVYNDANKGDCSVTLSSGENIKIDFDTWCGTSSTINGKCRRLGTYSWGDTPLHKPYVTKWRWYWLDEFGKWIEYGKQEGSKCLSDLTSKVIEEKYMENVDVYEFKAGSNEYVLDLKGLQQTNKVFKTARKVRRRPEKVVKSIEDPTKKCVVNLYPKNWSEQINSEYQLVEVSNGSDDYNEIKTLFCNTLANNITKISRIQNPELWEDYASKTEKMKKKSPDGKVEEKRLFHGTDEKIIPAICQQGFDFRLTGTRVGTLHGKGSYFARDAKYSNDYVKCEKTSTCGKMFVVKVLVGEYCQSSPTYVRPPPKNPANPLVLFDSCVNSPANPSIYVIFENTQCYPEYLIEYQR